LKWKNELAKEKNQSGKNLIKIAQKTKWVKMMQIWQTKLYSNFI
jgi:hypothetical protein